MFKQTTLIAASAVVIGLVAAPALAQQGKGTSGYLTDTRDAIIKDPYNLCWRTGYWTPAIANCECDKDLLPREVCEPPPPPKPAAAPPPPAPTPAPPPPPKPVTEKVTFAADVFFDFDKAVLKPEGKAAIDSMVVAKLAQMQKLEVVLVTGHTDRIGTEAYNQKLSERRADAVRDYLVGKGVDKAKIETIGLGEKQPVVQCDQKNLKALIECLQPNRRVEVQAKGETTK